MLRYESLLGQCFFSLPDLGGKYDRPKTSIVPQPYPSLKPSIKKAKFSRYADEVALVLEGGNLWFCHKIKVKNPNAGFRIIMPNGKLSERSIHFNYIPENENDLLIEHHSTVDITLYSHFSSPISHKIGAEKMVSLF